MRILPLLAALLAVMTLPVAAQSQDPVRHGRALAEEFCARCHAIGKRGRSPHSDAPPLRNIGRTYDLDGFARVLSAGLLAGHPDMPQFRFGFDDARALRDYLRTIQP
jgi:mono/diheme cytochrome c family protein